MLTTLAGLSTIVETLNGNGVSYSANLKLSHSKQSMGLIFLRIALITQLVLLTLFVTLTQYLHYRLKTFGPIPYPQNVRSILVTLWISSTLIGIRAVYRTVEYFSISSFLLTYSSDPVGSVSPIIKYEAFFWVFEASLMLANSCLLDVRNPMAVLPTDSRVYLAEDGARELPGPGYEDVRFFLVAMVDPFDLVGLLRGRGRRREFWKEGGEGNGVAADLEEGALTAGKGVAGQDDGIEGAGGVGKEGSGSGQGAGSTVTVAVAGDVGPGDVGSGTGLTFDTAK